VWRRGCTVLHCMNLHTEHGLRVLSRVWGRVSKKPHPKLSSAE